MAYRAGVVGRVRVHRGRAAAAAGRPPRDRGRARHRRHQRGRGRRRALPVPARRLRAPALRAARGRRPRRPRPRVLRAAARREPGAAARPARPRRPRRRPRRRLPAARRRLRALVRRAAPRARAASTGSRSASSSSTATRSRRTRTSRRPAATRPRSPRAGAARRARARRADGIVVDAVSGVSGAGRGLKTTSLFSEANENVTRLRAAHAPAHRRDGAGAHARSPATDVQVLFTPHLVPMTRGILATCYARPADDGLTHRAAARALPRVLRRRAVRGRRRRPPGTKATSARTPRTSPCASTSAPAPCSRSARGQPREGRVGSGGAERQPPARPPRDHRPPARRDASRERHAAGPTRASWRGGRRACGHQGRRAPPTSRSSRPTTARRCRGRGVFTTQPVAAAPVQISRAHLADGRAAAVVLNSGNANAATGEPGRRDARRMCELTGGRPRRRHHRRARVLDRPHRHPDADGAARAGHPEARAARSAPTAARRAAAGDPHHRHRAQGGDRSRRPARDRRRRHGQGRGDAVAGDGHDARGAHHRRRGRARRRSSRALQRVVADASTASWSTGAAAPTTPCSCSPTAAAGDRDRPSTAVPRHRRAHRGVRVAAEQMARDAEGATKLARIVVQRRAHRRPRRGSRPARSRDSQLVQCSLYGNDPYWGRVLSRARRERRVLRSRAGRHRLQRRRRLPRRHRVRARRGRARRARWPAATSTSSLDLHAATARRRCSSPTSPTRTSTRTWERRDARPSDERVAHRRARRPRPRRGAAVHPRVLGQDRRDQVRRPRDGRSRARRPVRARRRAHAPRRA